MLVQSLRHSLHEDIMQHLWLIHIIEVVLQDKEGSFAVDVLQEVVHHIYLIIYAIGIEHRTMIWHVFHVILDDAIRQRLAQIVDIAFCIICILAVQQDIPLEYVIVSRSLCLGTCREMGIERKHLDISWLQEKLYCTIVKARNHGSLRKFRSSALEMETAILDNSRIQEHLLTIDNMLEIHLLDSLRLITHRVTSHLTIDGEMSGALRHQWQNAHDAEC